jgi:hypothetical protein
MNLADLAQYGIAVILIAYMAWRDQMFNKTISNHFKHSEDAYDRALDVISKNTSAFDRMHKK